MAHFKLENVTIKKLIEELRDERKKPILKNIFHELREGRRELSKMTEEELELYEVYLKSVLDKLSNVAHFVAIIALAGVMFTILKDFFLQMADSRSILNFLFILLAAVVVVFGTYPMMSRRRSGIVLMLKLIEYHKEETKESRA